MREPYGSATVPVEAFDYEEHVDGTDHDKYLLGQRGVGARGPRHQGVRDVRLVRDDSRRGERRPGRRAAGAQLPHRGGRHRDEVPDRGADHRPAREGAGRPRLRAARAPEGHANAAFFSVQSAQKPKVYDTPQATANARISAQLPYIFATSRFAHYLKVMMRDKIGGYMSRSAGRGVPQPLDPELRRSAGFQPQRHEPQAAHRGARRCRGSSRQAGRLSRGRLPAAALPARRTRRVDAPRRRPAAAHQVVA